MESVDSPAQIFTSSSLAVCRQLVLEGVGISALPIEIIQEDIDRGRLHVIDTEWTPSQLNFTASHTMKPYKPELLAIINLAKTIADSHIPREFHNTVDK